MTDPKLLPCPFCGIADLVPQVAHTKDCDGGYLYQIGCCECGADGPPTSSRESAAFKWNKRTADINAATEERERCFTALITKLQPHEASFGQYEWDEETLRRALGLPPQA